MFLDPAERSPHLDWDGIATCYVSGLRRSVGPDTDDERFLALVGELSLASASFRDLWNRHDVRGQRGGTVVFDHPQVGEMTLHRERLAISGTEGMTLTVYHAEPGSTGAERLALLASSVLEPAGGSGPDRSRTPKRSGDDR